MDGHVEIIRLEVIGHLPKALQSVLPDGLLKSKGLSGLVALLGDRTQKHGSLQQAVTQLHFQPEAWCLCESPPSTASCQL